MSVQARSATRFLFRAKRRLRRLFGSPRYEQLYDEQAQNNSEEDVIGDGPYDLIGRLELGVLLAEGLRQDQTLVDFGCGNGRLAVHAIPYLAQGTYSGIDICREFLRRADLRIGQAVPNPTCHIEWIHQTDSTFRLAPHSADMMCAFSVFTHLEHEDAYRYLQAARRVVKPGGKFVFSCLPLDQKVARDIFEAEAGDELAARWVRVRNVATSKDMMDSIASMAGWTTVRWYDGDQPLCELPELGGIALGQSCCVLTHV